jgi:Tfp pilus assembly protein PilN
MRAVNLLPREADAKSVRNEDPAVVIGSVFGVIVIIALSAGFLTAHAKAGNEQKKLSAAQLQLGKLSLVKPKKTSTKKPVVPRPIIPIPIVTGEQAALLQSIGSAMSTRIAWDRILREFSLVVPDDVTIASLTLTAPQSPVAASSSVSGQGFALAGVAFSHDSVARLLARLMLIPDLTNVTLASSTASTSDGATAVQFSISAEVKGGPVPVVPTVPTVPTDTTTTDGSA